jgi:hypothetical protein
MLILLWAKPGIITVQHITSANGDTMKDKLLNLNSHLFAQLERLTEENISQDKLKQELDRSKAVSALASQIIAGGRLVLDAHIAKSEYELRELPQVFDSEPTIPNKPKLIARHG